MDQGMKKMMEILVDPTETNINLIAISLGDSAVTPDDRTLTALDNEHSDGKFTIGSWTVNASFPFDLEVSTTIPSDKLLPRTYVAKEIGIWFGPVASEFLFSRAADSTGVSIPAGAIPVDYDLVIV